MDNKYEIIKKGLIYFWGITFVIVGLKIFFDYIDTISDTVTTTISTVNTTITETTEDFNAYKLPIKEKFTLRVEGVNSCQSELKEKFNLGLSDESIQAVRNECSDDVCELVVDFKNEVPKFIEIAIKENADDYCNVKRFKVKSKYISSRYVVEVVMTDELREKLSGLNSIDEISLENAKSSQILKESGSSINTFTYSEKVEKDVMIINGKKRVEVRFY